MLIIDSHEESQGGRTLFGVSRTVIREAVRMLTAKGIIETRSGSRLRVAAVDAARVSETMSLFLREALDHRKVHEIRAMVEVQMASAAERATSADLARLEAACELSSARWTTSIGRRSPMSSFTAACTKNELYVVLLDSIGPALLNIRREALAVGAAAETRQPTGLGIACGCVLTGALPSVTVASG